MCITCERREGNGKRERINRHGRDDEGWLVGYLGDGDEFHKSNIRFQKF
jgi:hypothetical protein